MVKFHVKLPLSLKGHDLQAPEIPFHANEAFLALQSQPMMNSHPENSYPLPKVYASHMRAVTLENHPGTQNNRVLADPPQWDKLPSFSSNLIYKERCLNTSKAEAEPGRKELETLAFVQLRFFLSS